MSINKWKSRMRIGLRVFKKKWFSWLEMLMVVNRGLIFWRTRREVWSTIYNRVGPEQKMNLIKIWRLFFILGFRKYFSSKLQTKCQETTTASSRYSVWEYGNSVASITKLLLNFQNAHLITNPQLFYNLTDDRCSIDNLKKLTGHLCNY